MMHRGRGPRNRGTAGMGDWAGEMRELVESFDLIWDLRPDYAAFCNWLAGHDIGVDRPALDRLPPAAGLMVARCVLDMFDKTYELERAEIWEAAARPRID